VRVQKRNNEYFSFDPGIVVIIHLQKTTPTQEEVKGEECNEKPNRDGMFYTFKGTQD
jgi:hypothetical protein